jgi:hypothetical protein
MPLRASLFSALGLFTACIALQPSAAGPKPVPVLIGGEADLDACGAMGVVVGLNPVSFPYGPSVVRRQKER